MNDTTAAPAAERLADTLDETTLRQVFPDAPADLAVPRDVGSLFAARMRTFGGERRGAWIVATVALLLLGAGVAVAGQLVGGLVILGIVVLVVIGVLAWQHSKASDDFFDRYANARGLSHEEDGAFPANVPLLRKGDRRKFPRVLAGRVAGQPARLAHYTYTVESTDSDGSTTSTDYPFTILRFTLPPQVAARYPGVSLAPRSFSFGALQDKLQDDRKVELESSEFRGRYALRALDSQDDVALWELFSTPFVHLLATQLEIHWEQRGGDLVLWRKGHEKEAADLDRFCLDAWRVLHRYLEEWR